MSFDGQGSNKMEVDRQKRSELRVNILHRSKRDELAAYLPFTAYTPALDHTYLFHLILRGH